MNWDWVKDLNLLSYQGVWLTRLWIGTAVVIWCIALICTIWKHDAPSLLIGTWLTGLAGLSGVGAFKQKVMRETDYGYVERKAQAPVPASVTTVEKGAAIQQVGSTASDAPS